MNEFYSRIGPIEIPTGGYQHMRIRYETRDGRTYAYTSTSKRLPGRKNPVSSKEYLGVVDPETGVITEKVPRRSRIGNTQLEGADVRSYGDSLILFTIAERLGIPEDLEAVFGSRARDLLTLALAQASCPVSTDMIDVVVASSYAETIVDREGKRLTRGRIADLLGSVSNEDMMAFFQKRHARYCGKVFVYIHSVSVPDGLRQPIRGMVDTRPVESSAAMVVITDTGVPLGFELIVDAMDYESELMKQILRIGRLLPDSILITDTALSPKVDLPSLIMGGVEFALPYVGTSHQYRSVESDYADIMDESYHLIDGGQSYYLKEGRSAILMSSAGNEIIPESDVRFEDAGHVLRTFMCYDPKIRSVAERSMRAALADVRSNLEGKESDDPETDLILNAGPYARFLRCTSDKDGRLVLSTRRKAISEFHRDAGKTVVFLSSSGWDDVVSGRMARTAFTRMLESYYGSSRDVTMYRGSHVSLEQQFFLDYLVINVYMEMRSVLDTAGAKDTSVHDVLRIASTYKRVITDDGEYGSSRDRRVSRMFRIFGVTEP